MASSDPFICPACEHAQRDQDAGFCARCRFPIMLIAGKYRLQSLLGEGGFGYVYLAEHIRLQQEAERVVKIIKPEVFQLNDAMKVRFEREVQMTSILSQKCQHIVRIFDDFGEIPSLGHFYVMEYLQGQPVSAFLQNPAQLPPLEWCVHVFGQLCDAMRWAHEGDIVHRDLKPDNLMMINYGDEPHFLKVLDFGIAKPTDEVAAANAPRGITQGLLGTPIYMAPELFGEGAAIDYRVDLYAMGIILYEMLVGEPPFLPVGRAQTSFFRLLNSHLTEPPPSLRTRRPDRNIPEALEAVVMKALSKEPEGRFGSALAFKQAVYDAIGHPIDGPSLSIPLGFGPAPPSAAPRSGEVLVEKAPQPTPHFTPSQAPDPLDEALGLEPSSAEEATSVRPSLWQRLQEPAPAHTPLPQAQPPVASGSHTPLPSPHTPLPLSLQSGPLASPSQSGLPDMSALLTPPGQHPGNTPFPALHPPVAPPHSPPANPSHTGPSRASTATQAPENNDSKAKLLKGIAGTIGGLLLGLVVMLFLQQPKQPEKPDPPSPVLRGSAPPLGSLPSLPGTKRSTQRDDQRPLPIAPLNVRPLAQPDPRRSRRHHSRRKRRRHTRVVRRAAPRRTTCPAKRQGLAWHRIHFTPRSTHLSVQAESHSENEYLSPGTRCIWFRSHQATLKLQKHGYKTCYIKVRRLTRHLRVKLRRHDAPNTNRRDYCRFLH